MNKELLSKLTILYVEDQVDIKNFTSDILKSFTKEVFTAKDGLEGLELFKSKKDKIDIIITDINMPNLTGKELMYHKENYEKRNSKTPFLALTANSSKEDVEGYYKLGFSGFIPKPFTSTQFTDVLNKVLKDLQ